MNDQLLTVREVAERLKLSEFTVRKMCREKRLPGIKISGGKEWRIPMSELKDYIGDKK